MNNQKSEAERKSETRKAVHPLEWFILFLTVLLLLNTIRLVVWHPGPDRSSMLGGLFLNLGLVFISAYPFQRSKWAKTTILWLSSLCIVIGFLASMIMKG